jgi:hypothetical protein
MDSISSFESGTFAERKPSSLDVRAVPSNGVEGFSALVVGILIGEEECPAPERMSEEGIKHESYNLSHKAFPMSTLKRSSSTSANGFLLKEIDHLYLDVLGGMMRSRRRTMHHNVDA